jgi:uncharacterized protein involved in exopolysaccharide biosynthesis
MDDPQNSEVESAVWAQADESEPTESVEDAEGDIGEKIRQFLLLYWKKRILACCIIVAGAVLSIAYSLSLPNIFTSTTSLMPQDNSSPYSAMLGMVSGSSAAASMGSEALGISTPSELQVSILESRTVRDSMIAQLGLMKHYNVYVIEDARRALANNTRIEQDRKSGIITIAITDTNAEFAAKIAQGYVTELNRVLTDNSTSAARRERIFLEERLKGVKRDLDESSLTLSKFATKSKTLDIPSQARSMVEASFRLQGVLAEGESQLAGLRQTYSEDNYRVKALEARNAELHRQLSEMGGGSAESVAAGKRTSVYPTVSELPTLGVTYGDLERRFRVDEVLWETLTRQYESARVQEAKEIPTIHVLDPANIPSRKSAPRRSTIVSAATFISFLLSCVFVFLLSRWQEMDENSEPKKLMARAIAMATRIRHRQA